MTDEPYKNLVSSQIDLRDFLAIERTALSNERTLLAYVRTMIGLIAVGGTMVKLFFGVFYLVAGYLLMGFGLVLLVIGLTRYVRMSLFIHSVDKSGTVEMLHNDRLHQIVWTCLHKIHVA